MGDKEEERDEKDRTVLDEYHENEAILLELEDYFRSKPDYYKKVVHNLIQLYLSRKDHDNLRKLSDRVKTEDLKNLVYHTDVLVDAMETHKNAQGIRADIISMKSKLDKDHQELIDEQNKVDEGFKKLDEEYKRVYTYFSETIETDRIKSIEILGIFAAIITFIITGVEFTTTTRFGFVEVMILISQVGFALFAFILAIQILVPLEKSVVSRIFFIFIFMVILCWQIFIGFILYSMSPCIELF